MTYLNVTYRDVTVIWCTVMWCTLMWCIVTWRDVDFDFDVDVDVDLTNSGVTHFVCLFTHDVRAVLCLSVAGDAWRLLFLRSVLLPR